MSAEGHRSHGEIPVYKEKVKHFTYTSVQMHAHMHMRHYGEEILVLVVERINNQIPCFLCPSLCTGGFFSHTLTESTT